MSVPSCLFITFTRSALTGSAAASCRRISHGGGSCKLISLSSATSTTSIDSLAVSQPIPKQPPAISSATANESSSPGMEFQGGPKESSSRAGFPANIESYSGVNGNNSRTSWRPHRGRWNSKPAANREPDRSAPNAPEKTNTGVPRKNRKARNMKNNGRNMNPEAQAFGSKVEQPFGQSPSSQAFPSRIPSNTTGAVPDTPMDFPNFNSIPPFAGLPGASEFFNGQGLQFPPLNPPDQQQPQYQPSFNSPSWNGMDMTSSANLPPLMPPLEFMVNMGLQNPAMAGPMFNGFPFLPFDPMALATGGSPGGFPPMPEVPPADALTEKQKKVQSRPPRLPLPSKGYLAQSSQPPGVSGSSQPLLIILDLNGTLIYRKHRRLPPSFAKRAGLDTFLDTLLRDYKAMIWSSSQPVTVDAVCAKLFPGEKRKALVAEWGRDRLNLPKDQYRNKVQVYKKLETVWADPKVQSSYPGFRNKTRWDQTNTILIDDSKLKAASEPYNILEIPEFTNAPDDPSIFPKVLSVLEILAKYDDVSKVIRGWQTKLSGKTNILDLPFNGDTIDFHFLNSSTSSSAPNTSQDQQPQRQQPLPPTGPEATAQARKERRKIRKQERKARQKERKSRSKEDTKVLPLSSAAAVSGVPLVAAGDSGTITTTTTSSSTEAEYPSPAARSPSPATSSESENFLLDRLEESLNV